MIHNHTLHTTSLASFYSCLNLIFSLFKYIDV
nr:MAG TPA: hypothetical protein [Caudoviricetes sp.]